jgi:hypothetical protein
LRTILSRFGWVRSIGAGLTLASSAVVFVVLILPTIASGASKGTCPITITGFTPTKGHANTIYPDDNATQVTIMGKGLGQVDQVYFSAGKGSQLAYASTWDTYSGGVIKAEVGYYARTGKITLFDSEANGGAGCYVTSSATFYVNKLPG